MSWKIKRTQEQSTIRVGMRLILILHLRCPPPCTENLKKNRFDQSVSSLLTGLHGSMLVGSGPATTSGKCWRTCRSWRSGAGRRRSEACKAGRAAGRRGPAISPCTSSPSVTRRPRSDPVKITQIYASASHRRLSSAIISEPDVFSFSFTVTNVSFICSFRNAIPPDKARIPQCASTSSS